MQSQYGVQANEIQVGWDVYDVNGEEIGDVSEVGPNYIVVEKGWLFTSDIFIPTSAITAVAPDRIELDVQKDAIDGQNWNSPPAFEQGGEGTQAENAGAQYTDATLERREERLSAGTEQVQTGEVRIGKEVVAEEQTLEVPVSREEVQVSSRSVDRPASDDAFTEEEVAIPVTEERVTTSKEARVVEELDVEKIVNQDTERVTDTVRREEFRVEGDETSRR